MKFLYTLGLAVAEVAQRGGDVGTPLKTILGDLPPVSESEFDRWDHSNRLLPSAKVSRVGRSQKYYDLRTPDECKFPLEIVILQDLTDSFSDNIEEMKNTQLKQMVTSLSQSHPGSKFAMVSFQDKPLFPLGNRDDACWAFHGDFSSNLEDIYNAYSRVISYGGADAPENHFGAILAALNSKNLSWSPVTSEYARLIVVVTDAGPHHADDGRQPDGMTLKPWEGTWTDSRAEELCLKYHYPSAQQVYDQIVAHQTYVASLVFDGDWANGWAANEWKEFNRFIAQPDAFVEPDAEDSSQFWNNLSKIIDEIENVECGSATTPAPTTTTAAAPTTTTSQPKPSETTAECKPTMITDDCVPTAENCYCQPEVLIQIGDKPDHMNLVADDKVIIKK